jgi:hypothetical protein
MVLGGVHWESKVQPLVVPVVPVEPELPPVLDVVELAPVVPELVPMLAGHEHDWELVLHV